MGRSARRGQGRTAGLQRRHQCLLCQHVTGAAAGIPCAGRQAGWHFRPGLDARGEHGLVDHDGARPGRQLEQRVHASERRAGAEHRAVVAVAATLRGRTTGFEGGLCAALRRARRLPPRAATCIDIDTRSNEDRRHAGRVVGRPLERADQALGRRFRTRRGQRGGERQQQLGGGRQPHRERQAVAGQRPAPGPERSGDLVLRPPAGAGRAPSGRHAIGATGRHRGDLSGHAVRGAGPHAEGGLGLHQHRPRRAGPVPRADRPGQPEALQDAAGLGRVRDAGRSHQGQEEHGRSLRGALHPPRPGDQ